MVYLHPFLEGRTPASAGAAARFEPSQPRLDDRDILHDDVLDILMYGHGMLCCEILFVWAIRLRLTLLLFGRSTVTSLRPTL